MKVFQINVVCGIMSTGRICTDLAEVLEQEGHDCRIAYGRWSVPEKYKKNTIRIGNELNYKVDVLLSRLFDNAGFNSFLATKKLIRQIREYAPDIIHLHNLHGFYINIKVLFDFLRDYGKPVVWTLHDCWPFTGHCCHYDAEGCEKWKTQCAQCPQKRVYPRSVWLDRSKQNHRAKTKLFTSVNNLHFVAISDWIAQQKMQSLLKDIPHVVIKNGIDLEQFRPTPSDFREKYNIGDKRVYLGVANVWNKKKGLDTFLRLADMITDEEIIVMVGLSNEQLNTLPKNVIGITRTNSIRELAEIYTAADVFLNPTVEDTYPTVNLESIACGTPVVTFNTGGSSESVNQRTGIITPQGDVGALLEGARSVQSDSNEMYYESKKFTKIERYKEYMQLYEVVAKKGVDK